MRPGSGVLSRDRTAPDGDDLLGGSGFDLVGGSAGLINAGGPTAAAATFEYVTTLNAPLGSDVGGHDIGVFLDAQERTCLSGLPAYSCPDILFVASVLRPGDSSANPFRSGENMGSVRCGCSGIYAEWEIRALHTGRTPCVGQEPTLGTRSRVVNTDADRSSVVPPGGKCCTCRRLADLT